MPHFSKSEWKELHKAFAVNTHVECKTCKKCCASEEDKPIVLEGEEVFLGENWSCPCTHKDIFYPLSCKVFPFVFSTEGDAIIVSWIQKSAEYEYAEFCFLSNRILIERSLKLKPFMKKIHRIPLFQASSADKTIPLISFDKANCDTIKIFCLSRRNDCREGV